MGKKLDAFLGRTFRTSKFKSLANLATSRIAVFKNQRQNRCNQAHSDVLQLLLQGEHERALLRVEQVIKERNMLDVYIMMEGYCNVVVERVYLLEQDRSCPDELREAISSLLYASSRCGDFPELQEIRTVFTSRYGKDFVARAVELRNQCGVNPKVNRDLVRQFLQILSVKWKKTFLLEIIQKLSTRQPDLDSRLKMLKEIASENDIVLQLKETSIKPEEEMEASKKQNLSEPETSTSSVSPHPVNNLQISLVETESDGFTDSAKAAKKYRDVADAAQAAFESAAYAAAAARAAVELSRSDPYDPDKQNSPSSSGIKNETVKLESEPENQEIQNENEATELTDNNGLHHQDSERTSANSDIVELDLRAISMTLDSEELLRRLEKDIVFDESDNESHESSSEMRSCRASGDIREEEKQTPAVIQTGPNVNSVQGSAHAAGEPGIRSSQHSSRGRGPLSVRTRGVRGY